MRQIYSGSGLRDSDLAALYAYPAGAWLRANMVASADGAAHLDGKTRGLSSEADRHLFALLRTLADVIVVGAATVRAERYAPVRPNELWPELRQGRTPTPPIAVVTARLNLDPDSRLITEAPPSARTIVITTAQAPADRRAALDGPAEVIVAGQETVDLKAAVAALAERGHRRMLAEGGPTLLAHIATAGLLDELCLTIGPLLAGAGADRILAGMMSATPAQPLSLAHVLEDDGFLFCRYTRKNPLFRTDRGICSQDRPRRSMVDTQGGAWGSGGCDETATAAAQPGGVEPVRRLIRVLRLPGATAFQADPPTDADHVPAHRRHRAGPLAAAGRDRAYRGRPGAPRRLGRRGSPARAAIPAVHPADPDHPPGRAPAAFGAGA